jgi:putative serine protease PepD
VGHTRILSLRAVELLVVAVVGGALALGGAALLGRLGSHTTIQQVSPLGGGGVGNVTLQAPATGALPAEQIYKRDAPGVVQVTATDPAQGSESLGSGFVIDKAGHIVTNFHVVRGATKVYVSFSGQDQLAGTVVGVDPSTDIAVLTIKAHASALTPLELGNSDAVRVGDTVYAIGNPFGYTRTLTSGIVSAVQRRITAPNTLPIDNAIQTDAAINHGNSGGPLLDASGNVIGVNAQIESNSNDNAGVGFAIPIDAIKNVADTVIAGGKVQHAYLGVSIGDTPNDTGASISRVIAGSPADKAGLQAGDVVTAIGGKQISTADDLTALVATYKPGDKVTLTLQRGGSTKTVDITFGQRPS